MVYFINYFIFVMDLQTEQPLTTGKSHGNHSRPHRQTPPFRALVHPPPDHLRRDLRLSRLRQLANLAPLLVGAVGHRRMGAEHRPVARLVSVRLRRRMQLPQPLKNETMDNKNFNADQSIELIQRMIRDTRRNLSSGSSNLFILWEYLLAATAVGIFLLLTFTESRAWQWLWLPALAAGWAATWWYNRRRATQVKSYTDRLLEQIWECIAGLAAFSTFVICMEREWPVDPLFPVLLLISAGLFISGTVIHNKYMYYVSCFLLPVAFGIIRESWINVNPDGNLIQFAVAVLVGLTGSGYALKRQVKRDAAEASENR